MIRTQYDRTVIDCLAMLRQAEAHGELPPAAAEAFRGLDNAGVFADLDEQTDYASAEDILEETYRRGLEAQIPNTADPAEWGDTTSADMARHQDFGREAS